jgi:hypothetical protein
VSIKLISIERFLQELALTRTENRPDALKVSGFDMANLAKTGEPLADAMAKFAAWVKKEAVDGNPVFVGLNAGFDWSFVNWYFIHFTVEKPVRIPLLDTSGGRPSEPASRIQPREHDDKEALASYYRL